MINPIKAYEGLSQGHKTLAIEATVKRLTEEGGVAVAEDLEQQGLRAYHPWLAVGQAIRDQDLSLSPGPLRQTVLLCLINKRAELLGRKDVAARLRLGETEAATKLLKGIDNETFSLFLASVIMGNQTPKEILGV